MTNNRKEILEIVNKFTTECDKHNIWYSLDEMSILGAVRHGGFIPWHERFEVFITVEAYNKLKRLFPKNIIDSGIDSNYKGLTLSWVNNNTKWSDAQPFIKIRVIVPTTVKNLKKFKSISGSISRFLSFRKDNIKRAINDLHEPKLFQGFYFLDSRRSSTIKNWLQVLSGERVEIMFNNIPFKVAKEYKDLLLHWFGEDYMNTKVPEYWYEYPAPLISKKVE